MKDRYYMLMAIFAMVLCIDLACQNWTAALNAFSAVVLCWRLAIDIDKEDV